MKKKSILLVLVAVLLLGGVYGWSEYNRGAADANDMPVKEMVTAAALLEAFTADEDAATARFVGSTEQVVQVSGMIRSMEPIGQDRTNVVLATDSELAGVVCEFTNADLPGDWRSGAEVSVKGICTGLLLDVVLVRCVPVE